MDYTKSNLQLERCSQLIVYFFIDNITKKNDISYYL